jgi:hypothetical protein
MNCLEFRQVILADPHDATLDAHAASCEQCGRFREEILSMDKDIEQALNVPIPENLAARVLLKQSLSSTTRSTTWVRYGLAASFAAALVISAVLVTFYGADQGVDPGLAQTTNTTSTTQQMMPTHTNTMTKAEMDIKTLMEQQRQAPTRDPYAAHASHQPHDFYGGAHHPIDEESLANLMAKFQLTASLDQVVYAAICPLQGENAVHLVVKDGADQYTVMLLPDRSPGKMYTVDDSLWRGYVSPHPAGALAVLAAANDEAAVTRIRQVADKMQSAIYLSAEL